ncbi:hypothetical protein M8J75_002422 [Diaphorina citri]|nr:hypothetical protein M8J75_002422 [Diaphorina citri]
MDKIEKKCNAAVGVKSFFDMMHDLPHKLMLFGSVCTHVTDPIAKASKHWRLTQVRYSGFEPHPKRPFDPLTIDGPPFLNSGPGSLLKRGWEKR